MRPRDDSGTEVLPLGLKLVYGAPSFAGAAMVVPILVHLPKFYADVVLVPLGYLAVAIAIARSLDALSDPFVGWLSDRTRSRWGRRRPFMAVGAPLCALAFWALFSPPNPFVPGVRRALRNRPFRILLATYVVASVTGAIPGTLMPFFNAYVIRPANPALWLSIFLTVYFGAGLLCLPLWVAAARRFGKRPAWLASFVMGTTGG